MFNSRVLLLVAAVLGATFQHALAQRPHSPAGLHPYSAVTALRDEAKALLLVQSVISWYTRTVGEPSIQSETYSGHAALFSPASIKVVSDALAKEKDADQRRALEYFKAYLASEYLNQKLSRFDDEE